MQIRKLIRLLREAEKKVGPYAKVTIDKHTYGDDGGDWRYDQVSTVDVQSMSFVDENGTIPEHAQERQTIVLNSY